MDIIKGKDIYYDLGKVQIYKFDINYPINKECIEPSLIYINWDIYLEDNFGIKLKIINTDFKRYECIFKDCFKLVHIAYDSKFKYVIISYEYRGYNDVRDEFVKDNLADIIETLIRINYSVKEIKHEHFDIAFTKKQNRNIEIYGDGEVITYKYYKSTFSNDFNRFIASILVTFNLYNYFLKMKRLQDYSAIVSALPIYGATDNLFSPRIRLIDAMTLHHDGNMTFMFIDDMDHFYFVKSLTS